MAECAICSQVYGHPDDQHCTPASLPCGHVYCFPCLSLLSATANHRLCPSCRVPFHATGIKKLYLDFPDPPPVTPEPIEPLVPDDPILTQEQLAEATRLGTRLMNQGIQLDIEQLGRVVSDVSLWVNGVGSIADAEASIAMTRLLLGLDLVRRQVNKNFATIRSVSSIERKSRGIESALREKLNRGNTYSAQIRAALRETTVRCEQLEKDKNATTQQKVALERDVQVQDRRIRAFRALVAERDFEIEELNNRIAVAENHKVTTLKASMDEKKRYDQKKIRLDREIESHLRTISDLEKRFQNEKCRQTKFEDTIKSENKTLSRKLRDLESVHTECQRELTSKTTILAVNAKQMLRLKQEREHWREEYFELKEIDDTKEHASRPATPNFVHRPSSNPEISQPTSAEDQSSLGLSSLKSSALTVLPPTAPSSTSRPRMHIPEVFSDDDDDGVDILPSNQFPVLSPTYIHKAPAADSGLRGTKRPRDSSEGRHSDGHGMEGSSQRSNALTRVARHSPSPRPLSGRPDRGSQGESMDDGNNTFNEEQSPRRKIRRKDATTERPNAALRRYLEELVVDDNGKDASL